jgi:hypothetical protein
MARKTGSLFALTSPNGEFNIFHQFSSRIPGRVCVQNCLVERFGKGKVEIGKGVYGSGRSEGLFLSPVHGVGYFIINGDAYMVERITPADPRYNKSAVINEYSQFFGSKTVKAVESDTPKKVQKEQTKDYTKHLAAVKLLDDLLQVLGYAKSQQNVTPLRRAAKKKK